MLQHPLFDVDSDLEFDLSSTETASPVQVEPEMPPQPLGASAPFGAITTPTELPYEEKEIQQKMEEISLAPKEPVEMKGPKQHEPVEMKAPKQHEPADDVLVNHTMPIPSIVHTKPQKTVPASRTGPNWFNLMLGLSLIVIGSSVLYVQICSDNYCAGPVVTADASSTSPTPPSPAVPLPDAEKQLVIPDNLKKERVWAVRLQRLRQLNQDMQIYARSFAEALEHESKQFDAEKIHWEELVVVDASKANPK